MILGFVCVGLGYVGVILPGVPSTIFFICALWAFKRSSPRFESWLLSHRVFGPTLQDWDEYRAIKLRTKIVAISTQRQLIRHGYAAGQFGDTNAPAFKIAVAKAQTDFGLPNTADLSYTVKVALSLREPGRTK